MTFKMFEAFRATTDWYFTDPDTGQEFHSDSKEGLTRKIVAYRKQNGLTEIFELGHVVENAMCHRPENVGKCGKNPHISRSWWQTLRGGVALLQNMLVANPVSQEVADARAAICKGCKYNVFPDKGRFVKWSDRIGQAAVPGKRTAHHAFIGSCEVCTCPLTVKTWMPGPFPITQEEKVKMEEVGCWQISKEGE